MFVDCLQYNQPQLLKRTAFNLNFIAQEIHRNKRVNVAVYLLEILISKIDCVLSHDILFALFVL
jgi:hypothetical protein